MDEKQEILSLSVKEVVKEVEDNMLQISLEDAKKKIRK
jgi:hypothetical protein